MDFFASQEQARKSSRYLLALFALAIASIVFLANLAIYVVIKFQSFGAYPFDPYLAMQITGSVLVLVAAGSAYRIYSLKAGGEVVAAALGGQLVVNGGQDEFEQRLVNVVEEMAIASGLPVPPVYVLEEDGINAFAAGYNSNDAVVGVTRGAIKALTRDELQGVVAHEFSHIMHGDMSLNIRLVGLLNGILMLSHAGRLLLETRPGVARRSSGALPVLFFGLSLFLIGYLGKFFGDLIKAGVSRQREFLADASAVQYTRNNSGIADALKRIGGHAARSNVSRPGSDEFSHLYFSSGSQRSIAAMFATHPPLDERITRLEPNWSGEYLLTMVEPSISKSATSTSAASKASAAEATDSAFAGASTAASAALASGVVQGGGVVSAMHGGTTSNLKAVEVGENLASMVGNIGQVEVASQILAGIPQVLRDAVRDPFSVRAIIYCLFLAKSEAKRMAQDAVLSKNADVFVRARMRELSKDVIELDPTQKLPILELALPTLKQLNDSEQQRFLANVRASLKAASPIGLSQWALSYYLFHHMSKDRSSNSGSKSLAQVSTSVAYLLSMLAHSDHHVHQAASVAFESGCKVLDIPLDLVAKSELAISRLEQSVKDLNHLKPLQKPRVLKAFVATIAADDVLSTVEVELVRCFADAIDCPLPPLLLN